MKHLDNYEKLSCELSQVDLSTILFPHEHNEWLSLSDYVQEKMLCSLCTQPVFHDDYLAYLIYHRLKWVKAFKHCLPQKGAAVLEVGSGSSVNFFNALEIHDTTAKYITANMNKILTEGLRQNTANSPLSIQIIEDDANNILNHLPSESVDAVGFEHSVNDVLQAIVCEAKGHDTTNSDWFEFLPEMIKIFCAEYENGNLENMAKEKFLSLITNCLAVIKPGGYLIMSHYMFQFDLDLGYNPRLWEDILVVMRPWLHELDIGKEVLVEGFDPQWWIFYQK